LINLTYYHVIIVLFCRAVVMIILF
jgi:hypothetical protein